ncbi:hypothetical protein PG994_003489 [Apiospora phragmitis]|uniref:Cytochrome P450 n=1 Tax=Apiospora phragmitis TaxID=2905665 RepID=A0ABR1VYA7_9PEZI
MELFLLTIMRLAGLYMLYRLAISLYNLSPFHPLYKFPGPRLASMSYAYEAYYDFWLHGRYTRRIKAMHHKYGPIVRINPHELHCADPDMLDEIYAGGSRPRDKWEHYIAFITGPLSLSGFATISHDVHRVRKGAMARYFSRAQMLKLEGEICDFTVRTVDKMLRRARSGAFDVKEVLNCHTADIISQYCFGESMGFTDQEGFEPNFGTWVKSTLKTAYILRHIVRWVPGVGALANAAPYFARFKGENIRNIVDQQQVQIPRYIKRAISNKEDGRVFAELFDSPLLPESDKCMRRLAAEGFILLLAGTETTASTLSYIVYHLLSEPTKLRRLEAALEGIDLVNPKWTDLERVPYLWATIQEGLRLTPGIAHRSARKAPDEELVYNKGNFHYVVPKGTPIGMTAMIQNRDPTLFPIHMSSSPSAGCFPLDNRSTPSRRSCCHSAAEVGSASEWISHTVRYPSKWYSLPVLAVGLSPFGSLVLVYLRPSRLIRYAHSSVNGDAPWALVTGASDGIGRAFARQLAADGFNVVLHGRNHAKLSGVIAQLQLELSRQNNGYNNKSNPPPLDFAAIQQKLGSMNLTVLINNAGGGPVEPKFVPVSASLEAGMTANISLDALFPPTPDTRAPPDPDAQRTVSGNDPEHHGRPGVPPDRLVQRQQGLSHGRHPRVATGDADGRGGGGWQR